MITKSTTNAKYPEVNSLAKNLQSILDECARAGITVCVHTPRLYDVVTAGDVEVKTRRAWNGKSHEYYIEV